MERITGKKVLEDAVILVKDTGLFVYGLGKCAVTVVKKLFVKREKPDKCPNGAT